MCATVCPAECIYIEAGERPEKTIEKYPTRFEIDLLRCVYCGFCVDERGAGNSVEGPRRGGPPDFAKFFSESTKTLTIATK